MRATHGRALLHKLRPRRDSGDQPLPPSDAALLNPHCPAPDRCHALKATVLLTVSRRGAAAGGQRQEGISAVQIEEREGCAVAKAG